MADGLWNWNHIYPSKFQMLHLNRFLMCLPWHSLCTSFEITGQWCLELALEFIYDLQMEVSFFRVHGYIQSFCECGCVQHEGGKTRVGRCRDVRLSIEGQDSKRFSIGQKNGSRDPKKRHFREVLNCKHKNFGDYCWCKNTHLGMYKTPIKKWWGNFHP